MREADRRGVTDGIEKRFLGPVNRMGHLWGRKKDAPLVKLGGWVIDDLII